MKEVNELKRVVAMLVGRGSEARPVSKAAKKEQPKDEKQKVTYHFASQNSNGSEENAWKTFVETQPEHGWKVVTKKKAEKDEKPRDTHWSVPVRTFQEMGTATEEVCIVSDEDGQRLFDYRKE